jgi:hypothetical protein
MHAWHAAKCSNNKPPLQPYRAQGAAIAIEDAAVIGALFSYVSSISQVPALLHAYEHLRFVLYPTFSLDH